MVVRIHKSAEGSDADIGHEPVSPVMIRSLPITGLVITRATLVEALQAYVPGLVDVEVVDDGERFVLVLTPDS